ncbi:hypothetical protein L7F22_031143 [Adiantum nelumboides]|nr:hypothetical protein [Adiantum nelumboides]
MGSMYHSLTHALHSLRNPHFSGKSHALGAKKKPEDASEGKAFDVEIRSHLSQLYIPVDQGFLTLPWLRDALKSVLFTCSHISNLLPGISCSEKERVLLESNLEDTLSLLDVCNGLKEVLNDVQHYVMLVRYAARSAVDVKDASNAEELKSKLTRFHAALLKSADFMHARVEENTRHNEGRSKLETCSSMLRRIGEPLPEASPGSKRAASNALFNDMYAAKVLAIFVCSVLAVALSVKPKRPLSCVHMAEQPTWLDLLQQIQDNVKKLTDNCIEHGKIALLKELDQLRMRTNELREMLDKILKQAAPIAYVEKLSLSQQCEKLTQESDDLQRGLLALQQHVDGLFRMLVTIRVDFLDALCHV